MPDSATDRIRFVGPLERTLFLKTIPQFAALAAAELALLAQHVREARFRRGSVILRRGEPVRAFSIIVEGSAHVTGGERPQGGSIGAEGVVGFLSMIAGDPQGQEAVAETDLLALQLDADTMTDILEDRFALQLHLIKTMARATLAVRRQSPDGLFLGGREPLPTRGSGPIDLVNRLQLMTRGTAIASASLEALSRLASGLTEVRLPEGATIWQSGEAPSYAHMIVSGHVNATLDENRRIQLGTGYPMGNLETLASYPRWYDAVTATPYVALRFDTEYFLDILEDHHEMGMGLIATMAGGLMKLAAESGLSVPGKLGESGSWQRGPVLEAAAAGRKSAT